MKPLVGASARLGATMAAVIMVATACGSSGAPSSQVSTTSQPTGAVPSASSQAVQAVNLATLAPSSLLWLHAIAEKQNFYAQHHVKVNAVRLQSSSALAQAVSSGSADAGVSLGDNVISAVDKGASIVISGAILQKAALRLYGAPGVTDIKELAGKEVTAGAVQGGTADLLRYQVKQAGASADNLKLLAITNSSDRIIALKNGQVKGAELIPPYDSKAAAMGANMLGWYDKPYIETPLILNSDWAKSHKQAAQGLTQALADAAKWIYDPTNAEASQKILVDYTGTDATSAADAYNFLVKEGKVISPDLKVDGAGLQNIVDISAAVSGQSAPTLDIAKYYDSQYLGK